MMSDANTSKLFREFPNLYREKDQPSSHSRMGDGFCCGDGWFDLIYKLSAKLEKQIRIYKKENPRDDNPPCASQVKEKFGTLSFYLSNYTDEMRELVSEATNASSVTCEVCGRKGKTRSTRWVRTLCEEHFRERQG